ncbi:MAG: ParB/RepB/Spo0J family partition protein [Sulfurimonas sp.]|nr:ParB/RepB/Spo0J family partition protein [Sulfurimonas sp.]
MDSLERHIQMSPDGSPTLLREVEIHQLELRYAHTRVITHGSIRSLARSLDLFGQINPLVSVSHGSLVLIDGYRRVAALKRNRQDTAIAEVWPCTEQEAILRVLVRSRERKWEPFEEAGLLRELLNGSGLSQARLAGLLGKDPSWVARRLHLLDILNEEWIELIRSGQLSTWAASRVLVPLARANGAHALSLAGWIAKEGTSTRELETWFGHYQKSNNPTREKMIGDPALFLKAARSRSEQREARTLREGPEGRWLSDLGAVLKTLHRLQKDFGALHGTDLGPCRQILHQIKAVLSCVDEQIERIHHDQPGNQGSNPNP